MSAINPGAQTIAALRGFGGYLPSTFDSDSEQRVLLKVHSGSKGRRFIAPAFSYEMTLFETISSLFGTSCYNLRQVHQFLSKSHFLDDVEEQHKEYINLALRKLNEKIEKFNQLGLRPYIKWLCLETFPYLPVALREPMAKEATANVRSSSTLSPSSQKMKDAHSVILSVFETSCDDILQTLQDSQNTLPQKIDEFHMQLTHIENGLKQFESDETHVVEKKLQFIRLVLEAVKLIQLKTPQVQPFHYEKSEVRLVENRDVSETSSLTATIIYNLSLIQAFYEAVADIIAKFLACMQKAVEQLDFSQKQMSLFIKNLMQQVKDEFSPPLNSSFECTKFSQIKTDLLHAIEIELQHALRALINSKDAQGKKELGSLVKKFQELKKQKSALLHPELFNRYKEFHSQLSPLGKFSEEVKPAAATRFLLDAYELFQVMEETDQFVRLKKIALSQLITREH